MTTEKEIDMQEVIDYMDKQMFLEMVEGFLKKENLPEPVHSNGWVKVEIPCDCDINKCIAHPDRLDEVGCTGNGSCVQTFNLNKFLGIEGDDKPEKYDSSLLTKDEIRQLEELFAKMNKSN